MLGLTNGNDGIDLGESAIDGGDVIWRYYTGGQLYSSPAVANGIVYILSTNGNLYAVNAGNGNLVWSVLMGPGSYDWSSPTVHDRRVFVVGSNGNVYCRDAATGNPIWTTFIGGSPNSMMAVANGKVYSGTHNFDTSAPTLVALDEVTGAVIWTYDHHLWHPPTVGMINCNGVTVADGDGDGDLEVYFGIVTWDGAGNEAICLDEATGNEVWTQNLNGWSTSTPAVHNGKVFIGSDDMNMYALNAANGNVIWTSPTGGSILSSPAVADGKVYFGSQDHWFYCLDEQTGVLIWNYDTSTSRIDSSPAVGYGMVLCGNENGKVFAWGQYTPPPNGIADYTWTWTDSSGHTETLRGPKPKYLFNDDWDGDVTLTVTDFSGKTDTDTVHVTVYNKPPKVINTLPLYNIDEGTPITVIADVSDPGSDDLTFRWNWGDASPDTLKTYYNDGTSLDPYPSYWYGTAPFSASNSALHYYGDNGVFKVTLTVKDDDGGTAVVSTTVTVNNLAPTLSLDTTEAILFAGGYAFLGREWTAQTHDASAKDPGSDDLIFTWDFEASSVTNIYYNDGMGPDPFPSPLGIYPFYAVDSADVTYTFPGVYTVTVTVTDDDGASDSVSIKKIVVGEDEDDGCRTQGFWSHQFSEKGKHHYDDATLLAYLEIVEFASGVFGDGIGEISVDTITEARDVMNPKGKGPMTREKATAQFLAAWLNFASGRVDWDELIDTDGDGVDDTEFNEVIWKAEAILLDTNASKDELEHAKDLAEAVNVHV